MRSPLAGTFLAVAALSLALGACGGAAPPPENPLTAMRRAAASTQDGEALGRWLLGELVVPGGDLKGAGEARKLLDAAGPAAKGLYASLARAVDDEAHGRFRGAALAHVDAIAAARLSHDPAAALVAWYAAAHLLALRTSVANLWDQAHGVVEATIEHPGGVGWRARGELVEWWSLDGFHGDQADAKGALEKGDGAKEDLAANGGGASKMSSGLLEQAAKMYGCAAHARMAGPFGRHAPGDHLVHFDAERPGPWPFTFPRDPERKAAPQILPVERIGCALRGTGAGDGGLFYVETFVDLPAEREVLLAVQGALSVLVDDTEVLTRDTRQWGVWPRFGAHLSLQPGRHRIVAKLGGNETSIRLMQADGTPLGIDTSSDPAPPYAVSPPELLPDPNVLEPFLTALGVPRQKGVPAIPPGFDAGDPILRMLAANLAHVEGQDDVSGVLMEPLVKDSATATGIALSMEAVFLEKDPIFPSTDGRDLVKDVRARAAAKDSELWWPRFWLALDEADKVGLPEVAPKLVELGDHFREVPDILKGLSAIYGRVGWKVEHAKAVREAAARFPDDLEALHGLLQLDDEEGRIAEADTTAARIRKLDPDAEVEFERAVERRDFKAAIHELERLGARRKDRKDIAARVADLLTREGASKESMAKLDAAVAKSPEDGAARLARADASFAHGDSGALRKGLVDAIHTGADTAALREAIELVDGTTELSPYRIDGSKVIAEFQASGVQMPGTAARVLDYSALWIHGDGSGRMLEHEIICIQSREAIQEHAEQRLPRGLVLKLRTIKRDGQVLEPELIEGKPTVTMPHLEVGDYIETESLASLRGDGQGGRSFVGPTWFFREEKMPYWRSEFITISPRNRPLDIEVGGAVPAPQVTSSAELVVRRWRVDKSPALPEEPASAPLQEFIPNVRVGWGVNLKSAIDRLVDQAADETPRDPRLVRVAETIASDDSMVSEGAAQRAGEASGEKKGEEPGPGAASGEKKSGEPKGAGEPEAGGEKKGFDAGAGEAGGEKKPGDKAASATALLAATARPVTKRGPGGKVSADERARRIYRWVLANVEAGRETDPRRVIIGKTGNRADAFIYLCRLLGIEADVGVVHDRLAPPPLGPIGEAEEFGVFAVRVVTEQGPRWMLVHDKFAPYGFMPSSLRGQPAVVLRAGAPRETTPEAGAPDGVTHDGTVDLHADGSATLEVEQRYEGKLAILLRSALETLPDAQLKETVEANLLPQSLPGARLVSIEVRNLGDLDAPLVLAMKLEMSSFARARSGELVVAPPFPLHLAALAALPVRETPLYISEKIATRVAVRLRVNLPPGAHVSTALAPSSAADGGRTAKIADRAEPGVLVLDRVVDLPAGRVQPAAYPAFQEFARTADSALRRDIVVSLAGGT